MRAEASGDDDDEEEAEGLYARLFWERVAGSMAKWFMASNALGDMCEGKRRREKRDVWLRER